MTGKDFRLENRLEGNHHEVSSHSCGMSNASIRNALVDLLANRSRVSALCIPTAVYAYLAVLPWPSADRGVAASPLCELGWKSLGVLELTALPQYQEREFGSLWSKRLTPAG